jgi:hypothetical protein
VRSVRSCSSHYPITAVCLHGGETAHVEAGAKRASLAGQYYCPQASFAGKPVAGGDDRLEHRGIERVHLVRPHQANFRDSFRNRYGHTFHEWFHCSSLPFAALHKGVVRI